MKDLRLQYQAEFESLVFLQHPKSLLDIGCGQGGLLRRAAAHNVRAVGIDNNIDRVMAAAAGGLAVCQAPADSIPFDDGSFDWTVCERSAHHFPDLAAGLREALRVSRFGIFVFEPWFDEAIASQALAADLDRWLNRLDIDRGHINFGPLGSMDFTSALEGTAEIELDISHHLILRSASLHKILADANVQPDGPDVTESYRRELRELVRRSTDVGFSEAGAMYLCIRYSA